MDRFFLGGALFLGIVSMVASVDASPSPRFRLPAPHGLPWGASLEAVERRLVGLHAQQRLRLVRITSPKGRRVEHARLSAHFSKGRFKKLKLVFFDHRLVRIKLYGSSAFAWLVRRAGAPGRKVGEIRTWSDPRTLRGIHCERARCELFDLRPMVGHGLSRQEAGEEFRRALGVGIR